MTLSEKIKLLRKRQDYSQQEVADALGVSRPTYRDIETGAKDPTLSEIKKLADILGVSYEILISDAALGAETEVVIESKAAKKKEGSRIRHAHQCAAISRGGLQGGSPLSAQTSGRQTQCRRDRFV